MTVPVPLPEPEAVREPVLAVVPEPEPAPIPEPAPVVTKPKPALGGLAAFESMIADAPEVSELPPAPEPPPWKDEKPAAVVEKAPEPVAPAPSIIEDAFYNDPLIQAALLKFEGKVVA
ncbi:MAG: hypothetical protein EOP85_22770 [Verrucomicrobiaceae bacterium]|nr:MAG: hypothetical protein EOP85_22770 [Verrucomicrobiaceae bacterium]